ncbi:hypothetical protein HPP92_022375 [Vanilla planifolia]|uniref:Uncharacterized protein n=1 Tax=Vanilla planifolia TaxID=51239 RepID=A0A835UF16_VANPL|nr:hypothetical protein HPP92_022375 [Vanilla planifolia]
MKVQIAEKADLSRRKRVKFAGFTGLREQGGDGGNPYEGARLSCFDEAKTSEYKYFKRLLEKAAHVHYADKFAKNDTNLKTIKETTYLEGSRSAVTSETGIDRSLLLKRNASYVEEVLYSPVQNSGRHESKSGATRSVEPSKVTPTTQLLHSSASAVWQNYEGDSATCHELEGTFSGKRLHLIQLAARTCSQQVDEFLSKSPNSSIPLFPNGMYEFCIGKDSYPTINSKAEVGFQEMQLVPFTNEFTNSFDYIQSSGLNLMPGEEMLTDSLLDLHAISVQEHPPPVFVPKDVDRFPITMCADFYQTTGFYSLKNSSFDLRLPDSAHCSLLRVKCLQNFSDGSDHSPIGVDFTLDMSKQSDGFGCFLTGNTCNIPEEELNSMGRPYKLPEGYSPIGDKSYSGSFQID